MFMLANNIIVEISCKCKSIKFINSSVLSDTKRQLSNRVKT